MDLMKRWAELPKFKWMVLFVIVLAVVIGAIMTCPTGPAPTP